MIEKLARWTVTAIGVGLAALMPMIGYEIAVHGVHHSLVIRGIVGAMCCLASILITLVTIRLNQDFSSLWP